MIIEDKDEEVAILVIFAVDKDKLSCLLLPDWIDGIKILYRFDGVVPYDEAWNYVFEFEISKEGGEELRNYLKELIKKYNK